MIIRGGNEGGLDGIDVWGTNIWIHDVEVTNKDECVTIKVCLKLSRVKVYLANSLNRALLATCWLKASTAIGQVEAHLALSEQTQV